MHANPLTSIIINNYNYARFLASAIESALNQSYPSIEVVVVDDGSTDESRKIIQEYSAVPNFVSLFKSNGGQTSAFNAALPVSRGEIVCFLDADDFLVPSAMHEVVAKFLEVGGEAVSKVHWPLWKVDEMGRRTGEKIPDVPLSSGNLRDAVTRYGPDANGQLFVPPTSGNAWARTFLQRVLPMPDFRVRPEHKLAKRDLGTAHQIDAMLSTLAAIYGEFRVIAEPQSCYRAHGGNLSHRRPWGVRQRRSLLSFEYRVQELARHCAELGINAQPREWIEASWYRRVCASLDELQAIVDVGDAFILVDDENWGSSSDIFGRRRIPFTERGGCYNGPPRSDEHAIEELERLRASGANYIVFAWPAFWWLEHYVAFNERLRSGFECVLDNDRIVAFDLHSGAC